MTGNFIERIRENSRIDLSTVEKALKFCQDAHKNQLRKSGEPYFSHALSTATILFELEMDTPTLCAGLLHDTVEDTNTTITAIKKEFGDTVADLVDGVTKISNIPFKSTEEMQLETYRKMLLSTAKDLRVLIIKLADRLHNLRTIHFLPSTSIKRIVTESLNVYVPLAHRLGMAKIRSEMEDIAFRYLYPADFELLNKRLSSSREEREREIDVLRQPLEEQLESAGIKAKVSGRPKHLYSIFKKMQGGKSLDSIYDMFAIRIIVENPINCYAALGIVHTNWIPVQYRFKDYIATPKANGYQSLHTAVVGPKGKMFEVQIRTDEMNIIAEDGIASHWLYKEERYNGRSAEWLKALGDLPKDLSNHAEFMDFFKIDLFQSEIFLFTPKGDLIQLPRASSVLDFAFAVHTDLGLKCVAGKINGRAVPLNTILKSGVTVEIITANHQAPSPNWLNWVKTAKAKRDIRHWLKIKSHHHSIQLGKELLDNEVKKLGFTGDITVKLKALFPHYNEKDFEMFYSAVGLGEIPIQLILDRIFPNKNLIKNRKKTLLSFLLPSKQRHTETIGIKVNIPDDISIHFGKCCQPLPGDRIIGYLVRDRGLEIHRHGCTRGIMLLEKTAQTTEVSWNTNGNHAYKIKLQVVAGNRTYLLSDISRVFSDLNCDIQNAQVRREGNRSFFIFTTELKNRHQLNTLYRELRKVKDIKKISRELLFKESAYTHE